MEQEMPCYVRALAERAPWSNFPQVIRNGDLGTLRGEPEYQAAKSGDHAAALDLVDRSLSDETVNHIRALIGNSKPTLLPVLATEQNGNNKIPLAMAKVISKRLGLDIELGIGQREKVHRTGTGADYRLVFNPTFKGDVHPGRNYLILDDTLTMGGTLASLHGYIENRGGNVIGAAVMTAHPGAVDLAVKPAMLEAIARKHGPAMNAFWQETFGYGIDYLTQGEAGHLRAAANVDEIRVRIAVARHAGIK
ncbi:phosphoribosyltransferase [Candidatus Thiosymbion oneisti]|uniref:phosphoribosyltransferase n=1 Tax=Candidatus Thiosymbion oneisti TaxID=589554 RepID=UPI00105B515B|nr:phosphoribosyltransferase [Candidatus Thiosymbion oneisti]